MKIFIASLSFLSGNFIYQFFMDYPDYLLAADRSYFQAVAMLSVIFYQKLRPKVNNKHLKEK